MLNKLLLTIAIIGTLGAGCTKYKTTVRTVPIPPEVCLLPPTPMPLGPIEPWDIDGDGPETDIGFKEPEVKIWLVYTYQMREFIDLMLKCPGVKQETNETSVRVPPDLSRPPVGQSRT